MAALIVVELSLAGSWQLLTQVPWLDECLTWLVVNDSSFTHGMAAIRGGVENTPPGFFMMIWPVARLFHGLSPVELRTINGIFALAACVGVYASCRVFVQRERAFIGALVIAIHPAVIVQVFQVRFYTFWLAGAAWLVYVTLRHAREPDSVPLLSARCLLTAIVVATHWFGIIAVALVTGGDLLARARGRWRWDALLPLVAGAVTLAACWPFLVAQRSGLSVPTWIGPLTWADTLQQGKVILGSAPMAVLIVLGLCRVVTKPSGSSGQTDWKALYPALSLLVFPAILVGMSVALQPVLKAKYMIPAVIPIGMLAGHAALPATAKRNAFIVALACVFLLGVGTIELRQLRRMSAVDEVAVKRAVAATDSLLHAGVARPIIFLRRFEQHPVLQQRPALASVTALLDFDGNDAGLPSLWEFERDMARRVNRIYPQFRLAPLADLARLDEFVVVAMPGDEPVLRRLFPGHWVWQRSDEVYTITRH